jgi:hypothetical protein
MVNGFGSWERAVLTTGTVAPLPAHRNSLAYSVLTSGKRRSPAVVRGPALDEVACQCRHDRTSPSSTAASGTNTTSRRSVTIISRCPPRPRPSSAPACYTLTVTIRAVVALTDALLPRQATIRICLLSRRLVAPPSLRHVLINSYPACVVARTTIHEKRQATLPRLSAGGRTNDGNRKVAGSGRIRQF